MIDIIIKLVLLFYIIMTIKHIYDINKHNKESSLISMNNINEIIEGKTILDPLIIKYNINNEISINSLIKQNPKKYFIDKEDLIRFDDFSSNENLHIFKNEDLLKEINYIDTCEKIYNKFKLIYTWNNNYYASIFKGNNELTINKNKHNICIIGCISGKCNIYLYNPIHEEYIYNKNSKKWSIPVDLEKNNLLYIPTNWYYNIETSEDCILVHIDADTYFTSIYNYYRN